MVEKNLIIMIVLVQTGEKHDFISPNDSNFRQILLLRLLLLRDGAFQAGRERRECQARGQARQRLSQARPLSHVCPDGLWRRVRHVCPLQVRGRRGPSHQTKTHLLL